VRQLEIKVVNIVLLFKLCPGTFIFLHFFYNCWSFTVQCICKENLKNVPLGNISHFCHSAVKAFTFLGCYAV